MKKFIKNTANSIRTKAIRLAATRRSGEGYIDTAVKILIAVVLGALLLAGLYALFGDVVMPTLNQRIKDIGHRGGLPGGRRNHHPRRAAVCGDHLCYRQHRL